MMRGFLPTQLHPPMLSVSTATMKGFTLVELILVILVLGIISAVTISRFISGNAFNATVLRDQIVSVARSAQQSALGRDSVTFTLTPSPAGDEVVLENSDAGGSFESYTLRLDTVALRGDINTTDSCETTPGADPISNANPLSVSFVALGDLGVSGVTGSTGNVNSALRVCIDGSAQASVCFSPSGFAYTGDCDG